MNKRLDRNPSLVEATFGHAGNSDSTWDKLVFTDPDPTMVFRYVGWVDVMGASHLMRRSPDAASKNIGCLHEAVLKACLAGNYGRKATLHPLADGVYVVACTYHVVADILKRVFRSYAQTYLEMNSNTRFSPIRAAIAYGRVVKQNTYAKKLGGAFSDFGRTPIGIRYFANVIHGRAFAAAHDAERKAPPFGIFHDESIQDFGGTQKGTSTTWPLEKWWCDGHAPSKTQQAFATAFGRRLLDHFDWIESHPFDSGMSGDEAVKKIAVYKKQIKEYFGLCNKPSVQDGTQLKESKLAGQTKRLYP